METDNNADAGGRKISILCGFALVFILGFAAGYYYPGEEKSDDILTVTDKSADCAELFEADASSPAIEPATAAAGTVLGTSVAASGNSASEAQAGAFAGSKNSNLYHTKDCQYVNRIKAENVVWFGTQAEAEAAGREPHSCAKG